MPCLRYADGLYDANNVVALLRRVVEEGAELLTSEERSAFSPDIAERLTQDDLDAEEAKLGHDLIHLIIGIAWTCGYENGVRQGMAARRLKQNGKTEG